jgi:dolichol-phosphate mannosyltransferase
VRLSVVIPCFNEDANVRALESRLGPVLRGLADRFDTIEVVLVDDGSSDGTWAAMEAFKASAGNGFEITLTRHAANAGLGQAMRTGLSAATGDVLVTTDSDATYRFEDIPALLDVLGPDVDLVTASPYHPDGGVDNVPAFRLLFSRGASLLYRILVRRDVFTWTALFRAYRRRVVRTVPFASTGFLAGTELLVNAIDAGFRAAEFPTVLHARVLGVSKAKIARTVRAHLGFQGHLLLRRVAGKRPSGTPAVPERPES